MNLGYLYVTFVTTLVHWREGKIGPRPVKIIWITGEIACGTWRIAQEMRTMAWKIWKIAQIGIILWRITQWTGRIAQEMEE